MSQDSILASCTPEFVGAWHQADTALILAGGFIDAACLLGIDKSGRAHVRLEQHGFSTLFPEEIVSRRENFLMNVVRQDRPSLEEACRRAISTGDAIRTEVRWRVGDDGLASTTAENYLGTIVSVRKVGETEDEDLLYLAMLNVSKRRRQERSLSKAQYTSALTAMFSEAFTCDLDTGQTEVLFGDSFDENGRSKVGFHAYSQRLHSDDRKLFWAKSSTRNLRKQLFGEDATDLVSFDLRRMENDQKYHWINLSISRIASFDERKLVLVCARNLDAQKEAQRRERELRSKAQNDALTSVFNRGTTEELISAALEARTDEEDAVLVVFDVDHFKRINDTYGHLMGDELLKMVATCIKGICRDQDIVGRIGGDEFVALLISDGGPIEDVVGPRIQRCLERVAQFSKENSIDPPVTLSAGVVPIDHTITNYKSAFACADSLLYEVKEAGRNGYRLYKP